MSCGALFFDLDGTLTDPKQGITRCIQHALASLDEPVPDAEALLWCIGPPLRESFVRLVGEARADRAVGFYRDRFADVGLFENDPYPEIHQTLAGLRQERTGMYVASSKPRVFVARILERYGLADFFDAAFGSELDGTRSDKGDLLAYAVARTGAAADVSVMIGDRKHDVLGARRNGMGFVGVLYGYGDIDELRNAGASVLVDWHAELPDLLP